MMCAGETQVEMKPQWEIRSENEGSRSVCAASVLRSSVAPRSQSEMGKL